MDDLEALEKSLEDLYQTWNSVRRETLTKLGKETALHIVHHATNWQHVMGSILSVYSREEQVSVTLVQFSRLFKEIHWLQFLYLSANYSVMHRTLRYLLEMMAQAYYVDTRFPGLKLNEQVEKAAHIEERLFGWNLILQVLPQVLECEVPKFAKEFQPTWKLLNKHVHPSAEQLNLLNKDDLPSLVTDMFIEKLAREVLESLDAVFDLIFSITFRRFPKIQSTNMQARFSDTGKIVLPNTVKVLTAQSSN